MHGKHLEMPHRFWTWTKIEGECLVWMGGMLKGGYGKFRLKGLSTQIASRVSYFISHGDLPKNLDVLHTCDNPACVNPSHLYLGNDRQNAKDRDSRGRASDRKGEKNSVAKLKAAQVIEIRKMLADGLRPKDIAPKFGVVPSTISSIKRGENWSHTK